MPLSKATLGYLYRARDEVEYDLRDDELGRDELLKATKLYQHVSAAIAVLEATPSPQPGEA